MEDEDKIKIYCSFDESSPNVENVICNMFIEFLDQKKDNEKTTKLLAIQK